MGDDYEKHYISRGYLNGHTLAIADGVIRQLLGLCINGVFDRFPRLKIIVGHIGEKLPFDLYRIDHINDIIYRSLGLSCKLNVTEYFKRNTGLLHLASTAPKSSSSVSNKWVRIESSSVSTSPTSRLTMLVADLMENSKVSVSRTSLPSAEKMQRNFSVCQTTRIAMPLFPTRIDKNDLLYQYGQCFLINQ